VNGHRRIVLPVQGVRSLCLAAGRIDLPDPEALPSTPRPRRPHLHPPCLAIKSPLRPAPLRKFMHRAAMSGPGALRARSGQRRRPCSLDPQARPGGRG
jgi:hypothetical protein